MNKVIITTLIAITLIATVTHADIGTAFTYQGRFKDGSNWADGNWAELDPATGLSRWQTLDTTPMTGYPADGFTDTQTLAAGDPICAQKLRPVVAGWNAIADTFRALDHQGPVLLVRVEIRDGMDQVRAVGGFDRCRVRRHVLPIFSAADSPASWP